MATAHDSPSFSVESTRTYQRQVETAAAALGEGSSSLPSVGVLLEPGMGVLSESVTVQETWTFADLPHFPDETGERAPRELVLGTVEGCPAFILEGALSLHEGYTPREVVFPVRVLGQAGVDTLLFANTADSVQSVIRSGSLVLVSDHINFQGVNPLVGPNVDDWGPRFPDMTEPYDRKLRETTRDVAVQNGVDLQEGIYLAALGPNRGTGAEYQMVRSLGADIVGTTLVPEVIAARHMDLRVLALSLVTAVHAGDGETTASLNEDERGSMMSDLRTLIGGAISRIGTERQSEKQPSTTR